MNVCMYVCMYVCMCVLRVFDSLSLCVVNLFVGMNLLLSLYTLSESEYMAKRI